MRIAIACPTLAVAGGIETYLESILAGLIYTAHHVALIPETSAPSNQRPIKVPRTIETFRYDSANPNAAMHALQDWKPEVIFAHGRLGKDFETALLNIAPAAYFVHNFYGTCISGKKTYQWPSVSPCSRSFGAGCLAAYLPRHCGGFSPLTMISLYRDETSRLDRLRRYSHLITHSAYMRDEYLQHSFHPSRVHAIGFAGANEEDFGIPPEFPSQMPLRLLFVGRLERPKGCHMLIESLQHLQAMHKGSIEVCIAGEGSARAEVERQIAKLSAAHPSISVLLLGWLDGAALEAVYRNSHCLVVPSLWPEPFARVGVEAASFGLPAVAFAQGGIESWLQDGVSGAVVRQTTALDLAKGIMRVMSSPAEYDRLREGALEAAKAFQVSHHLKKLLPILQSTAANREAAAS